MNAQEKGREAGFAYKISIIGGSKRHFEHIGKKSAQANYRTAEKQAQFLSGWMENWTEPQHRPTTPDDEILSY